jgi:hypothetical protein
MYKHPDIDYEPNHPVLKIINVSQIEETDENLTPGLLEVPSNGYFQGSAGGGVFGALSGLAKKASNLAASAVGYALRKDMTKALAKRWLSYYTLVRNIDNYPQKMQEKSRKKAAEQFKKLKKESGGKQYSYDDSKWAVKNGK